MRLLARAVAVALLVGAGPALAEEDSDRRIQAGKWIGPAEVLMFLDEAVYFLGEPDAYEDYESGNPKIFIYDGPKLFLVFNDLEGEDDESLVMAVTTNSPDYRDAQGIAVGSPSARVAEVYGADYERLEEAEGWSMYYPRQGIRFDFDPGGDLVTVIGVFTPAA